MPVDREHMHPRFWSFFSRTTAILAALWVILIGLSYFLEYRQLNDIFLEFARTQARTAFAKDIVLRKWATDHGGVYVETDSNTPPNPYLSHIPERDIETPSGKKLTLVNPAYMMRQIYGLMNPDSQASGHLTSLNPIRPENSPDPWERKALEAFAKGESIHETLIDTTGNYHYRYMKVLRTEQRCLECHAQQGYQLGDIRGGVSVNIPLNREHEIFKDLLFQNTLNHFTILCLGLFFIVLAYKLVRHQYLFRLESEQKLRDMVAEQEAVINAFSHDIRTPMVTLAGFSNELSQTLQGLKSTNNETLSPEERQEAIQQLQFIQTAVGQLRSLQNGILGYTRLWRESLNIHKVDMESIWKIVQDSRLTIIGIQDAKIHTGPLPECLGDTKAVELILGQLLDNSLKFAPEGCKPEIHFEGSRLDNWVVFRFSDQGIGIPLENRSHVFKLFHRVDPTRNFGGIGLGLSVVKFLIQRMGGKVDLADGPNGKGVTVAFTLPAS